MSNDWTAAIAGERMTVDGEFGERVRGSSLTPQQWNLVMTAVSFSIENPDDPDDATLVADTDRLPAVADELGRIAEAAPGGTRPGADGGDGSDGLLSSILGAFGGSSGASTGDDRLAEAERLADEYATRLEETLRERGRWQEVCEEAATG